jgi:tetratricopeptide (TPR) repeat protein
MLNWNRCAKINVKVLIIVILVTGAVGVSLFAARQVRRSILSKMDLEAGTAAFEKQDWSAAYKHFLEYLGRNPDDVEILKKCAKARLSVRPLEADALMWAISAYRRVMQLAPRDEVAYDQLAILYSGTGNFEELAYIARTRREHDPNDREAPLLLADALVRLNKSQEARTTLEKLIGELKALPDKHVEYVRACGQMSNIAGSDDTPAAKAEALEWLKKAVDYAPESVEALANRARFYRGTPNISGLSDEGRLALARKDLEAADALGTEDPRIRLFLGTEWMEGGKLDRAAAELQAAESLPQQTLEKHFFDIRGWDAARFSFAMELAIRKGTAMEGAPLADEALAVLTEKRHRAQVLPSAIQLYVAAGKAPEARRCLDEYLDALRTQQGTAESQFRLAYLQALVAKAEERPYAVIDALQPVVVSDVSSPVLWRLLAEAFIRTDQTRRAVAALTRYLRYYPEDPQITLQLAREYSKLGDWNKAFEAARITESLNQADITCKLLRIGAGIYLAAERGQGINTTKLEELSAELVQLRQEDPNRVDIRTLQASIAAYLGQPDKAESELKVAIKECEKPLRAEMQLVGHYGRTKRMAEALGICRAACERHSEVAEPWLFLADLHVANADYDSARNCLRQGLSAVTGKPEKQSLSIRLALLELVQGDRTTGIRLLSELAAQDEHQVNVRSLLLGIREIREDPTTAEKLIGELGKAEGESGLLWRLHQASLWLSSENWRSKQQDITDYLQYCIDADPQWSAPVLVLVGMYEKLNDFGRVEDTCRRALVRNPAATDIADRLLALLERQNRFADAQKVLQQIEATPQVASAWQVRMALRAGDASRAVDELKLRVSNDNRDAGSRIQLARLVYEQTKDSDQAFRYLKEAEAITPGSRTLTAVRASILRAEGRTEEAQQILDDYVADSNDFTAYWMRAVYLTEQGELERAEKDYMKLTTFAEERAAGYGLLSDFYASSGKLDKAITTLEEGLNAYPADPRLERGLMKLLLLRARGQDRQRALEILVTLDKRLPQDPELMKLRAMFMLEKPTLQSVETARETLENVVKLEPTAVDAHLTLISIAVQKGEYQTARDLANRALGSNPNNPALLSARGRAELALENTQMAVELARLALQKDPNNAEAISLLVDAGLSGNNRNLLEEALASVESAVSRDPANEKLLLLRAHVLASLQEPRKAIPEIEAYCQTKEGSGSVAALVTLADLYRLAGDAEQAKLRIDQAERIDPNNQAVVHARFLWLVSQNRSEELAEISAAYLSAKNQNPTMVLTAASILSASDSMSLKKEGLKLFEHAITLLPTSVDARFGLASSLYQTGNAERARNIYEELLQQNPRDVRILNDLAWILQEHYHRYADALTLANRGLSIAPGDLHLLDTRGTILSNMADRLAEARNDFEKLVELSPSDTGRQAKALLQLGRICAKLNDNIQAKQHLEKALKIHQKIDVFTTDERAEIARILQLSGM